jgi:nucleotide-binding universal stress UspA family protein
MMFKRILVPLDGLPLAERALPTALRLVRVINGTIVLLRVVNTNWPFQTTFAQRLPATAKFEAEKYLHCLVKSGRLPHVSIETIVTFGVEAPTILSTMSTQHIDIAVLCGHDYSSISRWVAGSVADKVTRHADQPQEQRNSFVIIDGEGVLSYRHSGLHNAYKIVCKLTP